MLLGVWGVFFGFLFNKPSDVAVLAQEKIASQTFVSYIFNI